MKKIISLSKKETEELGKKIAQKSGRKKIFCLVGDLGSGKTTFSQGFLKGLAIKGPYTSPTFLIMKQYKVRETRKNKLQITNYKLRVMYHIDAYRIKEKDLLDLGWEDIATDKNSIVLIEWADRVKKIIPTSAVWIKFKWLDENKREIVIK